MSTLETHLKTFKQIITHMEDGSRSDDKKSAENIVKAVMVGDLNGLERLYSDNHEGLLNSNHSTTTTCYSYCLCQALKEIGVLDSDSIDYPAIDKKIVLRRFGGSLRLKLAGGISEARLADVENFLQGLGEDNFISGLSSCHDVDFLSLGCDFLKVVKLDRNLSDRATWVEFFNERHKEFIGTGKDYSRDEDSRVNAFCIKLAKKLTPPGESFIKTLLPEQAGKVQLLDDEDLSIRDIEDHELSGFDDFFIDEKGNIQHYSLLLASAKSTLEAGSVIAMEQILISTTAGAGALTAEDMSFLRTKGPEKIQQLISVLEEFDDLPVVNAYDVLRKLVVNLQDGSARGRGSEFEAGASAYDGVAQFISWYEKLNAADKTVLNGLRDESNDTLGKRIERLGGDTGDRRVAERHCVQGIQGYISIIINIPSNKGVLQGIASTGLDAASMRLESNVRARALRLIEEQNGVIKAAATAASNKLRQHAAAKDRIEEIEGVVNRLLGVLTGRAFDGSDEDIDTKFESCKDMIRYVTNAVPGGTPSQLFENLIVDLRSLNGIFSEVSLDGLDGLLPQILDLKEEFDRARQLLVVPVEVPTIDNALPNPWDQVSPVKRSGSTRAGNSEQSAEVLEEKDIEMVMYLLKDIKTYKDSSSNTLKNKSCDWFILHLHQINSGSVKEKIANLLFFRGYFENPSSYEKGSFFGGTLTRGAIPASRKVSKTAGKLSMAFANLKTEEQRKDFAQRLCVSSQS